MDNALERIRELGAAQDLDARLVRVGWRQDTRISEKVRNLLLENCVEEWLGDVRSRSEAFLEKWAEQHGVDRTDIQLAMALSRLRLSLQAKEQAATERGTLQAQLDECRKQEEKLREDKDSGERYTEVRQRARDLEEGLQEAKARADNTDVEVKASVRAVEAFEDMGKELSRFSPEELLEWEEEFVGSEQEGHRLRRLIELAEEWYSQFGRSTDFHGAFVAASQVVAATCVGLAGRLTQHLDFDLCILDEASKATPTEALVPISMSRKWIVVGDPNQLPPYQGQARYRPDLLERHDLEADDLKDTVLEHLLVNAPEGCSILLSEQHRMIKPIGDLVSHCFYEGRLTTSEERNDRILQEKLAMPRPVTWYSTSALSGCEETRVGDSCKNFTEVRVVGDLLDRCEFAAQQAGRRLSVVLLSGYGPQVMELRRMVAGKERSILNLDVVCQTVDSFQGREAHVAVYSVARSNSRGEIGFLKERERLNVALSRGQLGLAIVGDSHFCWSIRGENPFRDVLDYVDRHSQDCAMVEVTE